MSTAMTPSPVPASFQRGVQQDAERYLIALVGEERAKEAAGQIALAFSAAVQAAKDPNALLDCTRESIVNCIALSAVTRLYPGGSNPNVFLVPKKGVLQWWVTHRGIATLAMRAGIQIRAVPVHVDDAFAVEFGEASQHEADPDAWPDSLKDLRGVYVAIRRIGDGASLGRPWMPTKAIQKRANKAANDGVWREWPIEQAQKTAIKWAMSRGYIPVESPELAVALDNDHEMIEIRRERGEIRALPDYGEGRDFAAEAQRLAEREKATVIPATAVASPAPAPAPSADPGAPHASWAAAETAFLAELDKRAVSLSELAAYRIAKGGKHPMALDDGGRAKLLQGLDGNRAVYDAWVAERRAEEAERAAIQGEGLMAECLEQALGEQP